MFIYFFADCLVERLQVEELVVAQFGIYPAINKFYLIFYQCLVFWFPGAGRCYSGIVMVGKIFQYLVYIRFIPVGFYYRCLQVVGNQCLRYTAHPVQATRQGIDKIANALGVHCHSKTIIGVRQAGNKNLAFDNLACFPVNI